MWKDKEIEENLSLDFALDFFAKIYSFDHSNFPFPFGTTLILLGNFSNLNLNLKILSHDFFKVSKWLKKRKWIRKNLKKKW